MIDTAEWIDRSCSQRPNTASSTLSDLASDQSRRAHNGIVLKLQNDVTAQHLDQLKVYFDKAPLNEQDNEKITTFTELWRALDRYRTIKPGNYTDLKNALAFIEANSCLVTLRKLEKDAFNGENQALEEERRRRMETENQLNTLMIRREKSHLGHKTAIDESGRNMEAVLRALQCERNALQCEREKGAQLRQALQWERSRREQVERELYYLKSHQVEYPALTVILQDY